MNLKKSLQTLKADLAYKERTLKSIQHHYPHIAHLTEEQVLSYFHVTTMEELKEHIQISIKSSLSTEDKIDDDHLCSCKDSHGTFKDLYSTQELGQQQADQLMVSQKVKLMVYPCPSGYGWHLTKG